MVTEKAGVDTEKLIILESKALQSLGVPEAVDSLSSCPVRLP